MDPFNKMPNLATAGVAAMREKQVAEQIAKLGENVEALGAVTVSLTELLIPILSIGQPEMDDGRKGENPKPTIAPLADTLRTLNEKLRHIGLALDNIRQRIEL